MPDHPKYLSIKNFSYDLSEGQIAKYPLPERDLSKLLLYEEGEISEDIYRNIDAHIPENALLIFNDTKVIHARLFFKNATGAKIEIFCLEPAGGEEMVSAMSKTGVARWNCMIGRASKWKEKILEHKTTEFTLSAEITGRTSDVFVVEFKWQPVSLTFAEILDRTGMMPIPPYLKREAEDIDEARYQTIYASSEGSVAAPTAGLHFSNTVFEKMKAKNIRTDYATLHVGAGTFKPVKAEIMEQHEMHAELIDVKIETIRNILHSLNNNIIAIGTTSLRTIESLYWLGVKAKINAASAFTGWELGQWEPYELKQNVTAEDALQALLKQMQQNNSERLIGKTQIMIAPGYELKIANALVTNFHQPGSTLLLLVAATVGNDWKKIYDYALSHQFRFLSYGDGSLLWYKKIVKKAS